MFACRSIVARTTSGGRVGPSADAVVLDQPPVEGRDLLERHAVLLARADSGGDAVDLVSALHHPLHERARLAHALDRLGRELDRLAAPGDAHDVGDA